MIVICIIVHSIQQLPYIKDQFTVAFDVMRGLSIHCVIYFYTCAYSGETNTDEPPLLAYFIVLARIILIELLLINQAA